MRKIVLLVCCTLAYAAASEDDGSPMVDSPAGSFCGSMMKSSTGRDIFAFRGIRYAEAPTGHNRFKQTTPAKCHDGIFDATKDGPICPQVNAESHEMSEDCLRLNVYTTQLPEEHNQSNRSVIIFIHPGAFMRYSGSSFELGPQYVLDQDVVFVSFNYRLGSLGFLNTGDSYAPGNAGLKDQVLALEWVQENIAAFGGNPKLVTLLGDGAGSASITLHMVSPMSKGLFHRILLMSGATSPLRPYPTDQKDLAKKQAELLGCPTETSDKMFDCLYEKSPEEFVKTFKELETFSDYPYQVWTPVVEQTQDDGNDDCDSDVKPFLIGQIEDLIREGKADFVPLYIGVDLDELGFLAICPEEAAQGGDNSLYDEFNDNWEKVAPKRFGYESGTPRSAHISKELRSFYFDDEPLKAGSWRQLANLYADALTIFRVHRFERLMATYSTEPIYVYFNTHKNSDTFVKWSNGTRFGIVHHDEVLLLFHVSGRPKPSEYDIRSAREVWEYIANFANTANPIPEDKVQDFPTDWLPSTKDNPQYLKYGACEKMSQGSIYKERMKKWDELFPMKSHDFEECDE